MINKKKKLHTKLIAIYVLTRSARMRKRRMTRTTGRKIKFNELVIYVIQLDPSSHTFICGLIGENGKMTGLRNIRKSMRALVYSLKHKYFGRHFLNEIIEMALTHAERRRCAIVYGIHGHESVRH